MLALTENQWQNACNRLQKASYKLRLYRESKYIKIPFFSENPFMKDFKSK